MSDDQWKHDLADADPDGDQTGQHFEPVMDDVDKNALAAGGYLRESDDRFIPGTDFDDFGGPPPKTVPTSNDFYVANLILMALSELEKSQMLVDGRYKRVVRLLREAVKVIDPHA